MNRYFLKSDWQPEWTEVDKETWIKAERSAGFRPKIGLDHPDYMTTCATGGFWSQSVEGRIEYDNVVHSGPTPEPQADA